MELIEAFTVDTGARIRRLRDSLSVGDIPRLGAEAHSIKGSARQMGAEAVAALCQEIEAAAVSRQVSTLGERVAMLEKEVVEVSRQMVRFSNGL
jgi:histidine phosphotransfer protein HptB